MTMSHTFVSSVDDPSVLSQAESDFLHQNNVLTSDIRDDDHVDKENQLCHLQNQKQQKRKERRVEMLKTKKAKKAKKPKKVM